MTGTVVHQLGKANYNGREVAVHLEEWMYWDGSIARKVILSCKMHPAYTTTINTGLLSTPFSADDVVIGEDHVYIKDYAPIGYERLSQAILYYRQLEETLAIDTEFTENLKSATDCAYGESFFRNNEGEALIGEFERLQTIEVRLNELVDGMANTDIQRKLLEILAGDQTR